MVGIPFRTSPCFLGSASLFRMHEILADMWLLVQDSQEDGGWHRMLRCRIGQTPQNDVSDAILQRLPGDLQSVLVGEFYGISGERVY